ncbi:L,D-transpeptidase family protein [Stappia sp. ICDLI1TA098]
MFRTKDRSVIVGSTSARVSGAVMALSLVAMLAAGPARAHDVAGLKPVAGEKAASLSAPLVDEDAPLQILVSLSEQRLDVYRGTRLIETTRVSSGKAGHGTPTGVFSILEKRRRHFSNIYDNAPMPYMQRLTWSGIALHEGRVPNYPASHGCVRLPRGFAKNLFGMTEHGGHVIVTRGRTHPDEIVSAALPGSGSRATEVASLDESIVGLRPGLPAPAIADSEPATVGAIGNVELQAQPGEPLRMLITRATPVERVREMQRLLDRLGYRPGPVDGVMGRKTREAIRLFQEGAELPITGNPTDVVLKALYKEAGESGPSTGRLLVRRKFKEIYAAGITLKDPDAPLGTYLFTLIGKDRGGPRWMGVAAEEVEGVSAASVLDRIEWTAEARAFVEGQLAIGSSLTVTDRPFRLHSGLGTDFVVMTRQ